METRLAVVSIWTPDLPGAVHFYHDVVGLTQLPSHDERPHFNLGEARLVLLSGKPVREHESKPERFPLLAFQVEDLDAVIERLADNQVPFPWGIEQDTTARWVMVHDPAGNLIELVEIFHP